MASIRVRDGKMFGKGVAYAKKVGGKYDAASRTWTLPDRADVERMLRAPGAYGWQLVGATMARVCPRCGTYCDGDCMASPER